MTQGTEADMKFLLFDGDKPVSCPMDIYVKFVGDDHDE
jgi:hypothetical protein